MPFRFDPARPGSAVLGAAVVGVVAGLMAALFLTIAAEPSIEEAIRIEHARSEHATSHDVDEELVSRDAQRGVGLFGAYALSGGAFGVLFAAAFVGMGRNQPDVVRRSLVAGTVLAGSLTVSPWLKFPPNPPAVGDPDTLFDRQLLYVGIILITAALGAGAARLSSRLRARGWDDARRVAAVTAAVALPLLVAYALLPGAPDPVNVPANLLWRFRLASLGGNLVLWTVLTLGFAVAATASTTRAGGGRTPAPEPAIR